MFHMSTNVLISMVLDISWPASTSPGIGYSMQLLESRLPRTLLGLTDHDVEADVPGNTEKELFQRSIGA